MLKQEQAYHFYFLANKNEYHTFSEFLDKVKEPQKNKDGKTIILYTNDKKEQHSFVKSAADKGYEVLELSGPLVSHLISRLEGKSCRYINEKIIRDFSSYTVNQKMMSIFGNECIFMHCLPANRGHEVEAEVIDGPQSVVWDEAQNRLHIQKEIIKWCL